MNGLSGNDLEVLVQAYRITCDYFFVIRIVDGCGK